MTSTNEHAGVTTARALHGPSPAHSHLTMAHFEALAEPITEDFLDPRRTILKGRAPRWAYAHEIRRKLAAKVIKPIVMLLALTFADVDDNLPLEIVLRPWLSIIALITEACERRDRRRAGHVGSVLPLVQRESRAAGELRQAENELLAHPDSPSAQARVVETAAADDAEQDRLVAAIRAQVADSALVTTLAVAAR